MLQHLIERYENPDDLADGQGVVIAARWILVASGLTLALWDPAAVGELRVQVVLILALAVANFFLQSQVLMRKPVLAPIAYAASAGDILVISSIIAVQGGFDSGIYVFYFPAILAISVAFRPSVTLVFTAATVAIYGMISVTSFGSADAVASVTRMITIGAVGVCGSLFWQIERDRRRAAAGPFEDTESRHVERATVPVTTGSSAEE